MQNTKIWFWQHSLSMFRCEVCDYSIDRKDSYDTHLKSKKHIKNVNEDYVAPFKCDKCYKSFTTKGSLSRHSKQNRCKEVQSNIECRYCHRLFNSVAYKCEHQRKCLNKQSSNNNEITEEQLLSPIKITEEINISSFGHEDLSFIVPSFDDDSKIEEDNALHAKYISFLRKCILNKTTGLVMFLQTIFFNQDHVYNHTIRKYSKRDHFHMIHWRGQWFMVDPSFSTKHMLKLVEKHYMSYIDHMTSLQDNNELTDREKHKFNASIRHFMQKIGCIIKIDLGMYSDVKPPRYFVRKRNRFMQKIDELIYNGTKALNFPKPDNIMPQSIEQYDDFYNAS